MTRPDLTFALNVTEEQAETFTEGWFEDSLFSVGMSEAFAATELILWPDDDLEAQARYMALKTEIVTRTLAAVRPAAVETFLRIAREVLVRELLQPDASN